MKVMLVVHGAPPELDGGTERHVRELARRLALAGDEPVVVAGTLANTSSSSTDGNTDGDPACGVAWRVHRIARRDLYFDHWQKSVSDAAGLEFEALVQKERPDVVHVHHWLRTSRDLIARAARLGVPSVATLHDAWTSCLITFRVRPGDDGPCDAPLAAHPCLSCAQAVPPKTPWVPLEAQYMALAERGADLLRELMLARAVIVPSRAHGAALRRHLGLPESLVFDVVAPLRAALREPRADVDVPRVATCAPRNAASEPLILASFGRLSPLKGQDLLLRALAQVRAPRRVRLLMAGACAEPDFEVRLQALAAACDPARIEIRFLGAYDARELATHELSTAHAFVAFPRAAESYGFVVDEARALGLPLIVPAHPAFVERAAANDAALFFAVGDVDACTRVLEDVCDRPQVLEHMRAHVSARRDERETRDDLDPLRALYARAVTAGAPPLAREESWFGARMRSFAEAEWDKQLASRSADELGFA